MGTIKEIRDVEEEIRSLLESLSSALLYSELCHCPEIYPSITRPSIEPPPPQACSPPCRIPTHWTPQFLGFSVLLAGAAQAVSSCGARDAAMPCHGLRALVQAALNKKGCGLLSTPH